MQCTEGFGICRIKGPEIALSLALKGFIESQLTWRLLGRYWFKDGIVTTCTLQFRWWDFQRRNPQFLMELVIRLNQLSFPAASKPHWPKVVDLPGTSPVLWVTRISVPPCSRVFSGRMTYTFAHIPKWSSNETLSAVLHSLWFKTYGMMRCGARVADTEISQQSSVLIFQIYEVIKMRVQCYFETSKSVEPTTQLNIPQNQNLKR